MDWHPIQGESEQQSLPLHATGSRVLSARSYKPFDLEMALLLTERVRFHRYRSKPFIG